MTIIVYATTNPGKYSEVSKLLKGHGLTLYPPQHFGAKLEVEEVGDTLEDNAILKAEAYRDAIKEEVVVLGDDTGLEIDALGGEPGIHVRRWKGYRMEDEEIIDYALERLKAVPLSKRTAKFRTVIAVAKRGHQTKTFSGVLPGLIATKPDSFREAGLPFQPLFFATEYQKMIYNIHALPTEEKLKKHILTHRERAVNAALAYVRQLARQ